MIRANKHLRKKKTSIRTPVFVWLHPESRTRLCEVSFVADYYLLLLLRGREQTHFFSFFFSCKKRQGEKMYRIDLSAYFSQLYPSIVFRSASVLIINFNDLHRIGNTSPFLRVAYIPWYSISMGRNRHEQKKKSCAEAVLYSPLR